MIRKSNKNLLNWIYEYIIDFTDEKDVSGLTWTSTHDEALKFLHSIPQKKGFKDTDFIQAIQFSSWWIR